MNCASHGASSRVAERTESGNESEPCVVRVARLEGKSATFNGRVRPPAASHINHEGLEDSVLVTEPNCLPPVTNPVILNPAISNNLFTFSINTVTNRNFVIEYRTNLSQGTWQTLETLPGNGNQQAIGVPVGPDNQRFYRFLVQ